MTGDEFVKMVTNFGEWQPIETAPKDGHEILVCFEGRFKWVMYIAAARGAKTWRNEYAPPTHWMPLPEPPEISE